MGFFDFLSSPAQDPTMLDERGGIKKAKKQLEQDPSIGEMPKDPAAEPSTGPLKVEVKDPVQDRNKLLTEITTLRDKVAEEIARERMARTGAPGDPSLLKEAALKEAPQGRYGDVAKALERHARDRGIQLDQLPSFRRLEQATIAYRKLASSQPVQAAGAQARVTMGRQDVPNIEKQLQSASDELMRTKEELSYAPTERATGDLRKQEKLLTERVNVLADQLSAAKRQADPQMGQASHVEDPVLAGQPAQPVAPSDPDPVTNYMKGLGVVHDKQELTLKVHEAMRAVGIPADQWGDLVNPQAGLLRVLSALDPQGQFAAMVADEINRAKAEDAAGKESRGQGDSQDPRIMDTERAIESKEARVRELYASLAQAPFMSTWPGVILYVLVGLLTQNPAFAARLIGGVGNREAVDRELKGLSFDLRRLDERLEHLERLDSETKKMAAQRLQRRSDTYESRQWEMGKLMLQHRLMIERAQQKQNPETGIMKKLSGDFNRSIAMAAKFSKTKDDPFADERAKAEAKANFDIYMRRAAELNEKLMELGADYTDEEDTEEVDE